MKPRSSRPAYDSGFPKKRPEESSMRPDDRQKRLDLYQYGVFSDRVIAEIAQLIAARLARKANQHAPQQDM